MAASDDQAGIGNAVDGLKSYRGLLMRTTLIIIQERNWSSPMHRVSDQGIPLPFERNVMLWSMRVWVIGLHHDIAAGARIHDVMERLGAEDAAPYLDGFMFAVSHGAKRRISIQCACHPRIEPDERILLDILSLAQENRTLEALLLLRGMVHDKAAIAVLRSAQGLGTELALADHFLQAPGEAAWVFETPGELTTALGQCAVTMH